ncbi:MAG: SAF domain-containing protein, partial [Pseudomonadota bacterium]
MNSVSAASARAAETSPSTIRLHPSDSVIIALRDMEAGDIVDGLETPLRNNVQRGHKIAATPLSVGDNVMRYGQIIGQATQPIEPGDHIHTHNLAMADHKQAHTFPTASTPMPAADQVRTYIGYRREDGRAGTR